MGTQTVLVVPKIGDVSFPFTPLTMDIPTMGSNIPVNITASAITNNGASVLTGAVSGAGFTSAVYAALAPAVRYLPLTDVHSDDGLPLLTATAATTKAGIARTAGSSLSLTGVATSGATPATTKMIWEFDLPATYTAGAAIPVVINTVVPIATNVTAAATTMTVAAYSVSALGVETAMTVSAAQQIAITTASTLTFSVTGTGRIPGDRIVLELTALVTTTSGGASSVVVNSVGFTA